MTTVVDIWTAAYDVDITRRGKYGNSFHIGPDGTRAQVIAKYEARARADPAFMAMVKAELRGLRLG